MPTVRTLVEDSVATLVLDDEPRKNAMTPELGDALRDAVRALVPRRDVRAVILTGAGEAFSGGGDLTMLERLRHVTKEESKATMLAFYARYLSILDLEVPTIAAVRGPAIGAGLSVALACDMCICAEDAKLASNFARLGLYPGMGTTYFLERRVGALRASELLLTGRRFSGVEAAAWGIANEAVPSADVLARAWALAAEIAHSSPRHRARAQGHARAEPCVARGRARPRSELPVDELQGSRPRRRPRLGARTTDAQVRRSRRARAADHQARLRLIARGFRALRRAPSVSGRAWLCSRRWAEARETAHRDRAPWLRRSRGSRRSSPRRS